MDLAVRLQLCAGSESAVTLATGKRKSMRTQVVFEVLRLHKSSITFFARENLDFHVQFFMLSQVPGLVETLTAFFARERLHS